MAEADSKKKKDYYLRHVCLSVRVEQLGPPIGQIFMKINIWFFFFRKSAEKIQILLKPDKNNNRYLTWRHVCIYDSISLISS